MTRKKVLFLIGSPNQTTQMHRIAELLGEAFDPYYSQLYYDGWQRRFYEFLLWARLLNGTIVTGHIKAKADRYLAAHGLPNDFEARVYGNRYDLIVCCSDIVVPWNLLATTKSIFVQEGMTDPVNWWARLVRRFTHYPILAISTALNGMNNCCDIYCVASEGYAEHFRQIGVDPGKVVVTGIPNFDDVEKLRHNSFPHRGYVLVATTDMRETYRPDNRKRFIRNAVRIAAGRPLIFKFHPNENMARATAEVQRWAPADALIYTAGNTEEMIANCAELITQYSTVAFVGLALGIPVHSYFDVADLQRKLPWQNHGTSAQRIADICRRYVGFAGSGPAFLKQYRPAELSTPAPAAQPARP